MTDGENAEGKEKSGKIELFTQEVSDRMDIG